MIDYEKPHSVRYIGDLPSGYEYKILQVEGQIRIAGLSSANPAIAFIIADEGLVEMKID